jgi:hypothetical protein
MMRPGIFIFIFLLAVSCQTGPNDQKSWHHARIYPVANINPVSISGDPSNLFVSSGSRTEIHKFNYDGGLIEAIKNIRKPKYINILNPGELLVAESSAHVATRVVNQNSIHTIPTNEYLDTPYGVSGAGNSLVITDYYKNKVYYNKGGQILSFGRPGIGEGEFNGPTDIQLANNKIYVCDSRNNRVQVFDENGKYLMAVGEEDQIKTASGLFVTPDEIIVTDYTGNRVLIYDQKGKLKQSLTEPFDQPSDVFVRGREMFVVNYFANSIEVFTKY